MTSSRDPIEVPTTGDPSLAELDDSDRRLDQLSNDPSGDPVVRLLQAASAAPTEEELVDRAGFAALVALAAAPTAEAPVTAGPTTERQPGTPSGGRFTHLRRVLTTKAAIILGVTALGLTGAGAATGVYRAATSPPDGPTTTGVDVPPATADDPAADPSNGTDGTSKRRASLLWPFPGPPTEAPVDPALPDDTGSADRSTSDVARPDDESTDVPDDVDPGNNGATNGNSPNAGGNPTPGNNGATNGNSPNAGGNRNPGNGTPG